MKAAEMKMKLWKERKTNFKNHLMRSWMLTGKAMIQTKVCQAKYQSTKKKSNLSKEDNLSLSITIKIKSL